MEWNVGMYCKAGFVEWTYCVCWQSDRALLTIIAVLLLVDLVLLTLWYTLNPWEKGRQTLEV